MYELFWLLLGQVLVTVLAFLFWLLVRFQLDCVHCGRRNRLGIYFDRFKHRRGRRMKMEEPEEFPF